MGERELGRQRLARSITGAREPDPFNALCENHAAARSGARACPEAYAPGLPVLRGRP
jgi:hypothetical protein